MKKDSDPNARPLRGSPGPDRDDSLPDEKGRARANPLPNTVLSLMIKGKQVEVAVYLPNGKGGVE